MQAAAFGDDGEFRCPLRALPRGSAVRKSDGWDLDGSWDFCSGAPYATHFIGTTIKSPIDSAVGPELLLFLLPRSQWTMVDDWGDLIGFRGSGSHSIRIEHAYAEPGCVIPGRLHDLDLSDGTPGLRLHGNPMYAGCYLGFFGAEPPASSSAPQGRSSTNMSGWRRPRRRPSRRSCRAICTAISPALARGCVAPGRLAWDAADLLARKAGSTAATKKGQRIQRYLRDLLTYRSRHELTQFEAHATMLGRVRFGLPMWE